MADDGEEEETVGPSSSKSTVLLPLTVPDADDEARTDAEDGESQPATPTAPASAPGAAAEASSAALEAAPPTGDASPFFRGQPMSSSTGRDALAIADLLRAGSSGGASSSGTTPQPASQPSPHQQRYTPTPTPAQVDDALGGLPELLTRAGVSDDTVEDEPFGRKRVTTKKYTTEDDTHESWRRRKKHFFIFSAAGKPVFSRYGDENALAGFMVDEARPDKSCHGSSDHIRPTPPEQASMQAIISFVNEGGDSIRSTRTDTHLIVFLERGPLYLVCVSATGEHESCLVNQLSLLHGQLIAILTSGVEKALIKSPKFDMRHLLGGTDAVFASAIRSFTWDPACYLHAFSPLPMPPGPRRGAYLALQTALSAQGVLAALLLTPEQVVAVATPKRQPIHPDDLFLLTNFVRASESFRLSESFSPVCLPKFNASGFVYAYVGYLAPSICLVLLSTSSEAFYTLAELRKNIEATITRDKVLLAVFNAMQRGPLMLSGLPKAAGSGPVGSTCLWHFLYLHTGLQQFIFPKFAPPLVTRGPQKKLLRAYQHLHAQVHTSGPGTPHKVHFRCGDSFALLAVLGDNFELYVALDPLTETATAASIANRICAWCKAQESELLATYAS